MATRTVTGATKQRLPIKAKAGGEIAVFPPAFHICKRSLQRSLHKDRTGSRSERVPVPLHTSVGLRGPVATAPGSVFAYDFACLAESDRYATIKTYLNFF
jgi:hypothetical protein